MTDDFIERVCQMRFDELRKAGLSEQEALDRMGRDIEEQEAENALYADYPPPRQMTDEEREAWFGAIREAGLSR